MSATNRYLLEEVQLGDEIEVWWHADKHYYQGVVDQILPNGRCHVTYEDGDKEILRLTAEQWRFTGHAAHRVAAAHGLSSPLRKQTRKPSATTEPETIVIDDDDDQPPSKLIQSTVHSNTTHNASKKLPNEQRSISTQQSDVEMADAPIQITDHSPQSDHRASDVSEPDVSDNDQLPSVVEERVREKAYARDSSSIKAPSNPAEPATVTHSKKALATTTTTMAQPPSKSPTHLPSTTHRLPPQQPSTNAASASANTHQNTTSPNSKARPKLLINSKKGLSNPASTTSNAQLNDNSVAVAPVQNTSSNAVPSISVAEPTSNTVQSPPKNKLKTRVSQTAASKPFPTSLRDPKQPAKKRKSSTNATSKQSAQTKKSQAFSTSRSSSAALQKKTKRPSAVNDHAPKTKTAVSANDVALPTSSKALTAQLTVPGAKAKKRAEAMNANSVDDQPLQVAHSQPLRIALALTKKAQANLRASGHVANKAGERQPSRPEATSNTHDTTPTAPFKRPKKRNSNRQLTVARQSANPPLLQSHSGQKATEQSTILPEVPGYRKGARMLSPNNSEPEKKKIQRSATQVPTTSAVLAQNTATNPPSARDSNDVVVNRRTEGQQTTGKTDKTSQKLAEPHESSAAAAVSVASQPKPDRVGRSTPLAPLKGEAISSPGKETVHPVVPVTNCIKATQADESEIHNGRKADNESPPSKFVDTNKTSPTKESQQKAKSIGTSPAKQSKGMSERKTSNSTSQKRRPRLPSLKGAPSATARPTKAKRDVRNAESQRATSERTEVAHIRSPTRKKRPATVTTSTPTRPTCPPNARDSPQVSARHPSPKLVTSERIPRNKPPAMTLSNWPPNITGAQHATAHQSQANQYRWIEPAQPRMNISHQRNPAQSANKSLPGSIAPNVYSSNTVYPANAPVLTFHGAGTQPPPPKGLHGQGSFPFPHAVTPSHQQPVQADVVPVSNTSTSMSIRSLVSGPSAPPVHQSIPSLPHPPQLAIIPRGLTAVSPTTSGSFSAMTGLPNDPNPVHRHNSLTLNPLRPMIGFARTPRASPTTGIASQGQVAGRQTLDPSLTAGLNLPNNRTSASPLTLGTAAEAPAQQISTINDSNTPMNIEKYVGSLPSAQTEQSPEIQRVLKRPAGTSQPSQEVTKRRKGHASEEFAKNASPSERTNNSQRALDSSAPIITVNTEVAGPTQQATQKQFVHRALGSRAGAPQSNDVGQNQKEAYHQSPGSPPKDALIANVSSSLPTAGSIQISSGMAPADVTDLNSEKRGRLPTPKVSTRNSIHSIQTGKPADAALNVTPDAIASNGVRKTTLNTATKTPRSSTYARPRRRSQQKGRSTLDKPSRTELEIAPIVAAVERSLSTPFLNHVEKSWETKFEKIVRLFGNLKEESKEQSRVLHELKVRMDTIESATDSFAKYAEGILDVQGTSLPATVVETCKHYETELSGFVQVETGKVEAMCKATTEKVTQMNTKLVAAVLRKVREAREQYNGLLTSAQKTTASAEAEWSTPFSAASPHLESVVASRGQMDIDNQLCANPKPGSVQSITAADFIQSIPLPIIPSSRCHSRGHVSSGSSAVGQGTNLSTPSNPRVSAPRTQQNSQKNTGYTSISNKSKSSAQAFVDHEEYQPLLHESLVLIAKCVVQWLQKGECRKRAPKNEREVQVPQPWVKLTAQKCLNTVLSRLSAFQSYSEARESLIKSTKDARMETDWLTQFRDDNAIEKARNIYNWEPRLFDFEWCTEKKVIFEIANRIHCAHQRVKNALPHHSDPLQYSVACVTSSIRA